MSSQILRRFGHFIFVLPLTFVIVAAFDIPLGIMLARSVTDPQVGLEHYREIVNAPAYAEVVANTFRIAAITTAVCAVIGYPLAYWMKGLPPTLRLVVAAGVVLPFWVSILVRTYAWIVVLGNSGVVNKTLLELSLIGSPYQFLYKDLGVTIGTVNVLLPFLVLPLMAAMLSTDDRLTQAASSLGASSRTVFWRIFFPLTVPALAAGSILVFILTLGFFVTPAILGGGRVPMVGPMLNTLINEFPSWGLASAISVLLLVTTLVLYAVYRRVGRIGSTQADN